MSGEIRLFLVRHGNTFEQGQTCVQVGLATDLPLTAKGRDQAAAMGAYCKQHGIVPAMLYAGTLCRQTEAAKIIASVIGLEDRVEIGVGALEELDYGNWEGLTQEEIDKGWPNEFRDWNEAGLWPDKVFNGSFEAKREAIKNWLNQVRERHSDGESVIALGSNGSIRCFYSLIEQEWEKLSQERRMGQLKVKTGSFCELRVSLDTLEVVTWNTNPNQ